MEQGVERAAVGQLFRRPGAAGQVFEIGIEANRHAHTGTTSESELEVNRCAARRLSGPRGNDLLAGLLVNVRMQHPDERQIAIALREVQSVAHDEEVGDFEPHIVRFHRFHAARRFVQQHARLDPARLEGAELAQHAVERLARVENVIHQQHIAPSHVEPQFLGKDEVARIRCPRHSWRRR